MAAGHRGLPVAALLQFAVAEHDERPAAWTGSLAASAQPTATGKPCPSGPVLVSTPGTLVRLGWPLSGDSGWANVSSVDGGKKPQCASVA